MANWTFTTPTVSEAPAAWNALHERFRLDRGVTIIEVSPGSYEAVRYDAYTNELGAANYPPVNLVQPTGLNVFRGGYEWIVDDQTKADIIASNVGATGANFVLAP